MAAGEGRRLRPLTERWPKPVLPIDGRPVVVTLAHELARAGCERIVVVTGHLAEQVEPSSETGARSGSRSRSCGSLACSVRLTRFSVPSMPG